MGRAMTHKIVRFRDELVSPNPQFLEARFLISYAIQRLLSIFGEEQT